jgi:hypothetical protein
MHLEREEADDYRAQLSHAFRGYAQWLYIIVDVDKESITLSKVGRLESSYCTIYDTDWLDSSSLMHVLRYAQNRGALLV